MNKKLFLALFLLLPLTIMAQDLKFGYLNFSEIFQGMPEYVAATKKMDELVKTYENERATLQEEYQKKGSEFVASRDSLPDAIKTRRMTEIQALEQNIQEFVQNAQKELQKAQNDLVSPINTKLMNAVKAVGKEQNFVYIFDTSANAGLLYWSADKCVDVTNLVRAKLNIK